MPKFTKSMALDETFGITVDDLKKLIEENINLKEEIKELKTQIQIAILSGEIELGEDGFITAYHFKTGAIHRLLKIARN